MRESLFTLSALSWFLLCLLMRLGTVTSYEESWDVCWLTEPMNRDSPITTLSTIHTQWIIQAMQENSETSISCTGSTGNVIHFSIHFPSIIPPTATKHVYKSLLLWSSRVIRLPTSQLHSIKCQVFPGGGNSAVQPLLGWVTWHGERARPQEGAASHLLLSHHTTSWMRLHVLFSQKEWRADKTEQFIMLTCLVSLLNIPHIILRFISMSFKHSHHSQLKTHPQFL